MDYEVVIGLEVHAELCTNSKIYCSCKNQFGLEVNTQCCPICLGMPGTLPTLNENVVFYAIKMGKALNCKINNISKQDRKNYFYPDLPKAYQISQYDIPLCENGYIDILVNEQKKRIGITRIHIEEDAGKLLHNENFEGSLVDFNRCGVPLIEIVSEPDFRSSEEAKAYLEAIKSILKYLGVSDGKMQEGSIRCDVNVSVMKKGSNTFGTRCEMKNVNTFSGAVRAIEYEAKRQIELLESGGVVEQQTRRWDDSKGESVILRTKENANDYRYFPEPDLRTIVVSEDKIKEIEESIGETPNLKIIRFVTELGLSQVEATQIVDSIEKCKLFEDTIKISNANKKNVCNWILGDISKFINESGKSITQTYLTPEKLGCMIELIEQGKISNSSGKKILDIMLLQDKNPKEIIKELDLEQISDSSELENIVKQVMEQNQKSITDYKNGKTNAMGYLVGQCMKATKGQGNPALMKDLVLNYLKNC